jgi:hypothetical protein
MSAPLGEHFIAWPTIMRLTSLAYPGYLSYSLPKLLLGLIIGERAIAIEDDNATNSLA